MARHNRKGHGTDQQGAEYVISYQPDWLRQIKISRTLSGKKRQSTKTLFRNPASCAEKVPGDRVRTRVTSRDGAIDFEITVSDRVGQVEQVVVTTRGENGKEEITFSIDGSLPKPDDRRPARRGRRRRR